MKTFVKVLAGIATVAVSAVAGFAYAQTESGKKTAEKIKSSTKKEEKKEDTKSNSSEETKD